MKKHFIFGSAVALTFAIVFPNMSFSASMNADKAVFVEGTSALQGNAYTLGGSVTVSGSINGDLLAGGGSIFSSAKVNGDIMAAGGNINMFGVTAQDVRIAGGNIMFEGAVAGELFAAGGQLIIAPGTTMVKDSYIFGGTITFSGNEAGNLQMAGGDIYFDGTVNGNLKIDHANKLIVGPHAVIKGAFEYSAPATAAIDAEAKISGTPIFHQIAASQANKKFGAAIFGILTLWWFLKLLMTLTAAYLLWYFFRKDSLSVIDQVKSSYGKSLLHGFAFLILVPVGAIIAFITVIGVIPGLIAIPIYIVLLTLTTPLVVLFVAAFLQKWNMDLRWYHILLAAIVVGIVKLIPFVGWIACALVYLGVLGAVANVLREKFIER